MRVSLSSVAKSDPLLALQTIDDEIDAALRRIEQLQSMQDWHGVERLERRLRDLSKRRSEIANGQLL